MINFFCKLQRWNINTNLEPKNEKADTFVKAKIGSRTLFQFGISKEDKSELVITPTSVDSNELNIHEHTGIDENEVSGSIVTPKDDSVTV